MIGRVLRIALLVGIVAGAAAVASLATASLTVAAPWPRCFLVFAAVKLVGDAGDFWIHHRHETVFLEDYGREFLYFMVVAAVAAAAIAVARRFIGYYLDPALPAAAAYAVALLASIGRGGGRN